MSLRVGKSIVLREDMIWVCRIFGSCAEYLNLAGSMALWRKILMELMHKQTILDKSHR